MEATVRVTWEEYLWVEWEDRWEVEGMVLVEV